MEFPEKQIHKDRKQINGCLQIDSGELFGLMEMFQSRIVGMAAQLCKFIKKSLNCAVIMDEFYGL